MCTHVICCIQRRTGGEIIIDVVPGGSELEPLVEDGELGRLLALAIDAVASVWEFIACD